MADNILETRRKRFQFLMRLYEVTEASELNSVNLWELGKELGFSRQETDRIDDFWSAEGLIKHVALGGTICITHKGIVEVEKIISTRETSSDFIQSNFAGIERGTILNTQHDKIQASDQTRDHLKGTGITAQSSRPLRVFLCHAKSDKVSVEKLYHQLKDTRGIDPWLDDEKLLPGQNWRLEIPKAVRSSDIVIVCLSTNSISKEGYVQSEIRFAMDAALEKPIGTIFLIPLRLEECEVPESLRDYQWVNYFESNGFDRLFYALQARAKSLGIDL